MLKPEWKALGKVTTKEPSSCTSRYTGTPRAAICFGLTIVTYTAGAHELYSGPHEAMPLLGTCHVLREVQFDQQRKESHQLVHEVRRGLEEVRQCVSNRLLQRLGRMRRHAVPHLQGMTQSDRCENIQVCEL